MYNPPPTHYLPPGYQAPPYQQVPTNYGTDGYAYQGYQQYTETQQLPPPTQQPVVGQWTPTTYGPSTPKDAVAQEMQQQKAQLVKQREDYVKKVSVLRREYEQLRLQKQELVSGDHHHSSNILKENDKLQEEIQGKMKAIQNVIDMLSSIIKDGKTISDLEAMLDMEKHKSAGDQETSHKHHKNDKTAGAKSFDKYNYVHYDTGLHWCRMCDDFPETAKDYLLHLQDKGHRQMVKDNDVDNTPWHKLPSEAVLPSDENSPMKRVPIKGLQFFISAPSWYCKLCDVWIGDLHCASHHLKSQAHYQNYENFVAQNPHWEMEWLKDREIAMSRKAPNSSDSDEKEKKKKKRKEKRSNDNLSSKEKKRKKRSKKHRKHSSDSSSSSSSSDSSSDDEKSDRSKSIRVAMRNMKQVQSIMEEDVSEKWSVLEKLVEEHKKKQEKDKQQVMEEKKPDDPLINQWMSVSSTQDKDKQLLESLKDRMRQKQDQERIRQAEFEKKKKEKEREELERLQLKLKQEKEAAEEAEREKKRKEQEEYERIRDKERNQVRFKTNSNYRRRRSDSRSDDDDSSKNRYREDNSSRERHRNSRSRSRSTDRKMDEFNDKKKPPGPPSYKKLPFIGRMPLFKNKKTAAEEREEKKKDIQKESYDIPRRTRFEPGNLPRAFIPRPDVVCFPKLSSIPPLMIPPPPTVTQKIEPPEPPKISAPKVEESKVEQEDEYEEEDEEEEPQPPPPPKLDKKLENPMNLSDDEVLYADPGEGIDPSMMGQYYQEYQQHMMYASHDMYSYQDGTNGNVPHAHTLPLEPPPLPPDDDLAMLGICADDMAAQSF